MVIDIRENPKVTLQQPPAWHPLSARSGELLTGGKGVWCKKVRAWGSRDESLTLHRPRVSALTVMAAIKNPGLGK